MTDKSSTDPAPASHSGNVPAVDLESNMPDPSPPSSHSDKASTARPALMHRFRAHFNAEVNPSHTDLLLLICCFISGLVDSTIYDAFGTFVSMQTGNTIFLGLGGSTPHSTSKPYGWAKSFVSIGCFALGCLAFSHAVYHLGHTRRRALLLSFGFQSLVIFIAAAVVQGGVVNGDLDIIEDDIDWWTVLPIALLSFQSSGQIVGSRSLGLSEIPTVVLTSMIHDISTDRQFLVPWSKNLKRNRRVAAFLILLAGAIVGGFVAEGTEKMQIPLWIAGALKMGITIAWFFWPEKRSKNT